MRTTEDLGRWGGASGEEAAAELLILARARKLFAGLSRGLEGEIDRLEAALNDEVDAMRIKSLTDRIRICQKTLQTVLDQEVKLSRQAVRAGQGREVIDLAEARAEIVRRLARLAE